MGGPLFLETQIPFTKNVLCQVLLKFAQWFLRRRFLNFVNVFSLFRDHLPLEKGVALHFDKLESLYPRILCAKFGWNWPSDSWEGDENVKSLQTCGRTDGWTDGRTTDSRRSEKLTWASSLGPFNSPKGENGFFSSKRRYDIVIALLKCVYWFKLLLQESDVAHGPLVYHRVIFNSLWKNNFNLLYLHLQTFFLVWH